MKAVVMFRHGGPDVLDYVEFLDPDVRPGEVLVHVRACGVNYTDTEVRAGFSGRPVRLPHILGIEVAGEVVELGAEVTDWKVGAGVVVDYLLKCGVCRYCRGGLDNLCDNRGLFGIHVHGGYAEFLRCPASNLIPIPDNLTYVKAAALLVAFGTAWRALITKGDLRPGQTVLITGASGGVGTAAIQLAASVGACVIVLARSAEKLERLAALGANYGLNYTQCDVPAEVMGITGGQGVDVVLDLVGGTLFREGLACLTRGGRLVVAGAHTGMESSVHLREVFRNETMVLGTNTQTRAELDHIVRLASEGKLQPVVNSVYRLSEARRVHESLMSGAHVGKLVLVPDEGIAA